MASCESIRYLTPDPVIDILDTYKENVRLCWAMSIKAFPVMGKAFMHQRNVVFFEPFSTESHTAAIRYKPTGLLAGRLYPLPVQVCDQNHTLAASYFPFTFYLE